MNHDHKKHLLIMLACCLVPLAAILAVGVMGISFGAFQSLIPGVLALMCPLMMIFMMRGLGRDHAASDGHHHHTSVQRTDTSQSTQLAESKTPVEQKSCH